MGADARTGIDTWRAASSCCGRGGSSRTSATCSPNGRRTAFEAHPRQGYDYDECPAEALLNRMSVKDGLLALPDGMSYRLLALPQSGA